MLLSFYLFAFFFPKLFSNCVCRVFLFVFVFALLICIYVPRVGYVFDSVFLFCLIFNVICLSSSNNSSSYVSSLYSLLDLLSPRFVLHNLFFLVLPRFFGFLVLILCLDFFCSSSFVTPRHFLFLVFFCSSSFLSSSSFFFVPHLYRSSLFFVPRLFFVSSHFSLSSLFFCYSRLFFVPLLFFCSSSF